MKTILVADDEFDMTGLLRAILEGEGYRVTTCTNGRQAIERLTSSRPDLVLMDVMMPVMSGLEVLGRMRQTPGLGGVPVVLMSAVAMRVKREEHGWQAFLSKPFGLEELIALVERLIGPAAPGGGEG